MTQDSLQHQTVNFLHRIKMCIRDRLDSMWAVILPGAFSVWNMIIARTYYPGIPRELREAPDVDGASEMLYFFKILLPVCMPVVAVLAL